MHRAGKPLSLLCLVDENGKISQSELESIMHRTLGVDCPGPIALQHIMESVDKDHSGSIEFDEFITLMTDETYLRPGKDEMREAFDMFDQDSNGFVSASELRAVMASLGKFTLSC